MQHLSITMELEGTILILFVVVFAESTSVYERFVENRSKEIILVRYFNINQFKYQPKSLYDTTNGDKYRPVQPMPNQYYFSTEMVQIRLHRSVYMYKVKFY